MPLYAFTGHTPSAVVPIVCALEAGAGRCTRHRPAASKLQIAPLICDRLHADGHVARFRHHGVRDRLLRGRRTRAGPSATHILDPSRLLPQDERRLVIRQQVGHDQVQPPQLTHGGGEQTLNARAGDDVLGATRATIADR